MAGINIPRRSSGEANATPAVIELLLVGTALVAQEPRPVTSSHSAFVQFATTRESPNAQDLATDPLGIIAALQQLL